LVRLAGGSPFLTAIARSRAGIEKGRRRRLRHVYKTNLRGFCLFTKRTQATFGLPPAPGGRGSLGWFGWPAGFLFDCGSSPHRLNCRRSFILAWKFFAIWTGAIQAEEVLSDGAEQVDLPVSRAGRRESLSSAMPRMFPMNFACSSWWSARHSTICLV